MAILKHKENGSWVEVPLGVSNGLEARATEPTNPMTQVWVDTSATSTIADYVVEEGTSGSWNYRKWNSGKIELWASISVSISMTTSASGIYYARNTLALPFTLNSTIFANVTAQNGILHNTVVYSLSTSEIVLQSFSQVQVSATNTTENIYIVGTWK